METKRDIRNRILGLRKSLPRELVEVWSKEICKNILNSEIFLQADAIYGYMPVRNEADIRPVLKRALSMGKLVALPRVSGETMEFYRINSFQDLETGSFHVLEPKAECKLFLGTGMMILPLVVFDREGRRIGYGKGYYDRYISSHKTEKNGPEVLVGAAYKMQGVEKIPYEEHDYPLDYIATETELKKRG